MKRVPALLLILLLLLSLCAIAQADWTCAACGYANEDQFAFCPACGTAKPDDTWTCASCGHSGLTLGFCPYCGAAKPAGGWVPDAGDIGYGLYRMDTLSRVDVPFDLRSMDDTVVIAPLLSIRNSSNQDRTVRLVWVVDGVSMPFKNESTINAGQTMHFAPTDAEAARLRTAGTHTIEFYINDALAATFTWEYTDGTTAGAPVSMWTPALSDVGLQIYDLSTSLPLSLPLDISGYTSEDILPIVFIKNSSSTPQSFSVRWVVDGVSYVIKDDTTLEAGKQAGWGQHYISQATFSAGTHTIELYVNEIYVTTFTWEYTAGSSASAWAPAANDVTFHIIRWDAMTVVELPFDLSTVDATVSLAPLVYIANNSQSAQSCSIYVVLDGKTVRLNTADTLEAGRGGGWICKEQDVTHAQTAGTHTLQLYVNDTYVTTFTWEYTAGTAAGSSAAAWVPSPNEVSLGIMRRDSLTVVEPPIDLSTIDDTVSLTPIVYLRNSTSSLQNYSMYWVLDGQKVTIYEEGGQLKAGERAGVACSVPEASHTRTAGTHTLQLYVNDTYVTTFTWEYTDSRSTSAQQPSMPVAGTATMTPIPAGPTPVPQAANTVGKASIRSWDDLYTLLPLESVTCSGTTLTITFRDTLPAGTELTVQAPTHNSGDDVVHVTTDSAGKTVTVALPASWKGDPVYFDVSMHNFDDPFGTLYLQEGELEITSLSTTYDSFTLGDAIPTLSVTGAYIGMGDFDSKDPVSNIGSYYYGSYESITYRAVRNGVIEMEFSVATDGLSGVNLYQNGSRSGSVNDASGLASYKQTADQYMPHWQNGQKLMQVN